MSETQLTIDSDVSFIIQHCKFFQLPYRVIAATDEPWRPPVAQIEVKKRRDDRAWIPIKNSIAFFRWMFEEQKFFEENLSQRGI